MKKRLKKGQFVQRFRTGDGPDRLRSASVWLLTNEWLILLNAAAFSLIYRAGKKRQKEAPADPGSDGTAVKTGLDRGRLFLSL